MYKARVKERNLHVPNHAVWLEMGEGTPWMIRQRKVRLQDDTALSRKGFQASIIYRNIFYRKQNTTECKISRKLSCFAAAVG